MNRRDLPWRRTHDPYRIWVSEIMLQQTQVATVVPYYERFVESMPTVQHLAHAREHDVLRHWEGLGYYRRARQLHQAAKIVAERHQGLFPRSVSEACLLPGVGRYTAGAILSIAFDMRLPVVEANISRVLCRLLAFEGNPASAAGQKALWQAACDVLPRTGCGTFNQALMELGSLVCTSRAPQCHRCPVVHLCASHQAGKQHEIPVASSKARVEKIHDVALVVRRGGRVLVRQYSAPARWAGLWDFVRFGVDPAGAKPLEAEITAKMAADHRLVIERLQPLAIIKHGVTRFRIKLSCFTADVSAAAGRTTREKHLRWLRPAELAEYPLTMTARKIARLLDERCLAPAAAAATRNGDAGHIGGPATGGPKARARRRRCRARP